MFNDIRVNYPMFFCVYFAFCMIRSSADVTHGMNNAFLLCVAVLMYKVLQKQTNNTQNGLSIHHIFD